MDFLVFYISNCSVTVIILDGNVWGSGYGINIQAANASLEMGKTHNLEEYAGWNMQIKSCSFT